MSRLLPGLVLLAVLGCGGDGRVEVSGKVTWNGKPIPAGEIVIEPDSAKGNTGPQAYATIQDGTFRTDPARGSISGPVILTVRGYDGIPNGESPRGKRLFRPYEMRLELPQARNASVDVDVTESR